MWYPAEYPVSDIGSCEGTGVHGEIRGFHKYLTFRLAKRH